MTQTFSQNLWEKEKSESLLSKSETSSLFFLRLLLFFLPTQLAFHTWPSFSYVLGLRVDYLSPTLYVTDLLLLCSLFPLVMQKGIRSRVKQFFKTNKMVLGSFVLFMSCNLLFSSSPPNTIYGIYKLVEMISFFFLLLFFCKKSNVRWSLLYVPFLLGVSIQGVLAVQQFLLQGSAGGYWYYLGERTFSGSTPGIANASLFGQLLLRPYGTLPHPNLLAAYLLVSCGIPVWIILKQKLVTWESILVSLVLLFNYGVLLLTLSRVCIVLSIVSMMYLMFSQKNKKEVKWFPLFITILSLSAFFLSYLIPRFSALLSDQAYVERVQYMGQSVNIFLSHPLIGVGWNAYLPALGNLSHAKQIQPVHSIFFLCVSEVGIVGVLLLVWYLYRYWKSYKHSFNSISMSMCLLIFILGLFDHYFLTLQQGQFLLVILIFIIHLNNSVIKK